MFYLFPCIFNVKNIGFSSLSAKGFNGILLDFYTRRWAFFSSKSLLSDPSVSLFGISPQNGRDADVLALD
jgi:hypothetical protein